MSSLHAGWSFGGFAGAGAVALGAAAGVDPRAEAALAGAVLLVVAGVVSLRLGPATARPGGAGARFAPPRGVVLLAALCFLIMVTEGAMADWGGVYLRGDLHADPSLASIGFAGFSAGMAGGRLFGDRPAAASAAARAARRRRRWPGRARGLLLAGEPAVAVVGFTLVGLGVEAERLGDVVHRRTQAEAADLVIGRVARGQEDDRHPARAGPRAAWRPRNPPCRAASRRARSGRA